MYRARATAAISCLLLWSTPLMAYDISGFTPDKICTTKGKKSIINLTKVLDAALQGVSRQEIDKDGNIDLTKQEQIDAAVANSYQLKAFLQRYDRAQFTIDGPRDGENGTILASTFLEKHDLFTTECKTVASVNSAVQERRLEIDRVAKKAGEIFIVRKTVDDLTKDLTNADPASVSYIQNWIEDNGRFSYEITVGHSFDLAFNQGQFDSTGRAADIPASILPYARFVGQRNSNAAKTDVDNMAFGVRADLLSVPLFGLTENAISFRGEYLTDSEAETSIAAGEAVWEPIPLVNSGWLEAIGGNYYPLGPDGPLVRIEATGRLRYGHVYDAGDKPTLLAASDYLRIGGKVNGRIAFGGNDSLSGLALVGTYIYFDTLSGFGHNFYKAQAGLQYDVSKNFGFRLVYTKGVDEDKLDPINQLDAGFTFKF